MWAAERSDRPVALSADAVSVLEAIEDPSVVITARGLVVSGNRRGLAIAAAGTTLAASGGGAERYFRLAAGSRAPIVGAILVNEGSVRCRASSIALDHERLILLRFRRTDDAPFRSLTNKVNELEREIIARRKAQQAAESATDAREQMLEELKHRVRNNTAVMSSLLQMSGRDATTHEARQALEICVQRCEAINAVQRVLYGSEDIVTLDLSAAFEEIIRGFSRVNPDGAVRLHASRTRVPADQATSVCLVLNELLTNAGAHGRSADGSLGVDVRLTASDAGVVFSVHDKGAGIEPDAVAGTDYNRGIGLARALARQVKGTLNFEVDHGTIATLYFPAA